MLTLCQKLLPGTAPSREKAKIMREFAVIDAMPQKYWAPMTMSTRGSPSTRPAWYTKMLAHGTPAENAA